MIIDVCPGCGYPKLGPGLCSYCLPVEALTVDATEHLSPAVDQASLEPPPAA